MSFSSVCKSKEYQQFAAKTLWEFEGKASYIWCKKPFVVLGIG